MIKKIGLLVISVLILSVIMPYAVSCSAIPTVPKTVDVKINGFIPIRGFGSIPVIVFTITNYTERPITNVLIQFTYFNDNGMAVGVDHYMVVLPPEREEIGPHESYTGEYHPQATYLGTTAKAQVESFDYA